MKIKDYKFGYADAQKELVREPEIFEQAFYDPHDYLKELIDGYKYLIIGRKGTGKSAYSSKLQKISKEKTDLVVKQIKLNDFQFTTFKKCNIDSDIVGNNKYNLPWKIILLTNICKIFYDDFEITEVKEFNEVIHILKEMDLFLDISFNNKITKIQKLKAGMNLGIIDASIESQVGDKPTDYIDRLSIMVKLLSDTLSNLELNNRKLIFILDGLDDLLRIKTEQSVILSSLIRSIDEINELFVQKGQSTKIILLIREDMLNKLVDTDLNKIIRDSAMLINWTTTPTDLKKLVDLRFIYSGSERKEDCWLDILPNMINYKSSWDYLIQNTLLKPRDLLQFFSVLQDLFPEKEKINDSECKKAIKEYSTNYFIEEMKNELAGFIEDKYIKLLTPVFSRIGNVEFTERRFFNEFEKIINEEKFNLTDARNILFNLFENSYIGQIDFSYGKKNVFFKYRNPNAHFDSNLKFILHSGILRGLNIRL